MNNFTATKHVIAAASVVVLVASLSGSPTVCGQTTGAGESAGENSIEALERLAESKLRASHKAVKDQVDYQLTELSKGGRGAEAARTKLKTYASHLMGDGRSVGAHLVDTLLETKNSRLRAQLRLVLLEAVEQLEADRKKIIPKLTKTAQLADERLAAACELLAALRAEAAAASLSGLLKHENAEVRTAIIRLIGSVGYTPAGPEVLKAIESKDDRVQIAAIEALQVLNHRPAIMAIAERVDVTERAVSIAAIRALREMKAQAAIPTLLATLQKTKDAQRRREILEALGGIGPAARVSEQARVEKVLRGLMNGRDATIARQAAWALANLGVTNSEVERTLTRGYKEEMARDPRNLFNRLELARIYKALGEKASNKSYFNKAIKEYKFVQREDKRRKRFVAVTCVGLAGCYARMGQFRTASTYLSRLTRPDPRLSMNPDFAEMKKDPTYRRFFPPAN